MALVNEEVQDLKERVAALEIRCSKLVGDNDSLRIRLQQANRDIREIVDEFKALKVWAEDLNAKTQEFMAHNARRHKVKDGAA